MALTVKDWKAVNSGGLRGFCTVEMTAMIIFDVPVFSGPTGAFAGLPTVVMYDRDGKPLLDDKNKPRRKPVIKWKSRDTASQFSDDVVAALKSQGVEI